MTLGMHLEYGDNGNEVDPEMFTEIIKSVSGTSKTISFWALLYLSQFLEVVPDPYSLAEEFHLLEPLEQAGIAPHAEIRAASLFVITSMIDFEKETPEKIEKLVKHLTELYVHDASMLVRMQLAIFAQKLLENQEFFSKEFSEAFKDVINLVSILSQDPYQEISDFSTSILSLISNSPEGVSNVGILTALFSGAITDFLKVQFNRLDKYGFSPSHAAFIPPAPQPTIISQIGSNTELKFVEFDHYIHEIPLAADPIFIDPNRILFGDIDGSVLIRNIQTHKIEQYHMSNTFFSKNAKSHPLKKIIPLEETSCLLITSYGDVSLVKDLNSNSPMVIDCFSVVPPFLNPKSSPSVEYSYIDYTIYSSYEPGIISPWKFDTCSFLNKIKVCDETEWINCIKPLDYSANTLAIGTEDFRMVDLRTPKTINVVDTPAPPLKILQSKSNNHEFVVHMKGGGLSRIDFRSPQLVSIMEVEGVSDVWSCDWYPLYLINCQNLQLYDSNRNFYPLPSLVSPNLKNGFVTKAAFHPSEQ
ncbi:hypothetical protein TVAG_064720 [Trichomonas vaginalis G3]|uniref:Uncharacterized protein n=1 Tax=Trichomonas vaginalis (strain ATCC PRA-98 / G3) TaxID=412133 RepID=A2EHE6_TRIV3|nr:TOR signaling [Trichomonas vaginalis G3]EAY07924.1 hypothetical protein TVAG_064720 [Trichomonas vaginalis G3]KAI5531236.1 TOR signaling [Trichomonas vaginalis G3]|eukprot:XP_001320147.1 hypothetical protein [Trichomonas vaginalis G3]